MIAFSRAAYCNADGTAAVVDFTGPEGEDEVAILVAPGHRDDIWQALLVSGFPIEPFSAPAAPPPAWMEVQSEG